MQTHTRLTRKEKIEQGVPKPYKGRKNKLKAARKAQQRRETVGAQLRKYPTSPRKMRLVADLIRGRDVPQALGILQTTNKAAARPLLKLLRSAIQNWEDKNPDMPEELDDLYVKTITVDSAMMLKRIQPAPQGRAYRIRKRSNHVTLVIDSKSHPMALRVREQLDTEAALNPQDEDNA